jgi:hypothetical protein
MSIVPIRNVNLTAATPDMEGVFAAVNADIAANSTWLVTQSDTVSPPGAPGAFANTLQSPSGGVELTMINAGVSQASPSSNLARFGINPDGSADPVLDALNPQASAANFSGVDNGRTMTTNIANPEFILIEWADAIMILFKNATRTTFPNGWFWGKIWQQPIPALENSGTLRLDGHVIMNNVPNIGGQGWAVASLSGGAPCRRRIATGQGLDTSLGGKDSSWGEAATSQSLSSGPIPLTDDAYKYAGQRIVWPVTYHSINNNASDRGWLAKYLRLTSQLLQPYAMWRVSGSDQYMVIGTSAADTPLCVPIIPGFDPIP